MTWECIWLTRFVRVIRHEFLAFQLNSCCLAPHKLIGICALSSLRMALLSATESFHLKRGKINLKQRFACRFLRFACRLPTLRMPLPPFRMAAYPTARFGRGKGHLKNLRVACLDLGGATLATRLHRRGEASNDRKHREKAAARLGRWLISSSALLYYSTAIDFIDCNRIQKLSPAGN